MTDAPFTETHRRLTQALLDYWVRHPSTKLGEVGTPENVYYSVKSAVDVLVPVFDRLTADEREYQQEIQIAVDRLNEALAEIDRLRGCRETLVAENSWLESENAVWLNKSHELTRENDRLREAIHLALANKDRTHLGTVRSILADAVNAPEGAAMTDTPSDPIVQAAKAGWALAIERLRQAIRFSQGKMPLTAEECVTILENSDLPITLPEKRQVTP